MGDQENGGGSSDGLRERDGGGSSGGSRGPTGGMRVRDAAEDGLLM